MICFHVPSRAILAKSLCNRQLVSYKTNSLSGHITSRNQLNCRSLQRLELYRYRSDFSGQKRVGICDLSVMRSLFINIVAIYLPTKLILISHVCVCVCMSRPDLNLLTVLKLVNLFHNRSTGFKTGNVQLLQLANQQL